MKRGIRYSLVAVSAAVVAFVFWLGITAPLALQNQAETPEISLPVDKWLADQERIVSLKTPLIPGTEKHIHWYQNQTGSKTPISLVYLHGFSATRKELSPVPERVADALGANLFETRLKGNGQSERQMEGIRAEDWLNDAAEALTIGAAIGERVILMGTSNGGDAVVDPNRIAAVYEQIDSPHREVILIANSNDPSNHVLAGDIMSPDNNDMMVEQILAFVNQRQ